MKEQRPGRSRRTFWMNDDLYVEIQRLAKSNNSSMTSIVEEALRERVRTGEIERTDFALGPVVDRVLQERLRRMEAGLRALVVATLQEVLRTQYVVLNSAVESNSSTETVDKWNDQGWDFAAKQVKEHRAWIRRLQDDDFE